MKNYKDIDINILKSIPNPTKECYEVKIPDFAKIYLTFYPDERIMELKSLKMYVYQLRDITVSYERLINIIYDQFMEVYKPKRLRVVMICNPRGGISSKLTIDSDWKVRGGEEVFKDWIQNEDVWDVKI